MTATRYQTRVVKLDTSERKRLFIAAVESAPDFVEGVIREPVRARKPDQNALMWAGPLHDLAEQAWVAGRTYSAEVWHEQMKREYLPEADDPDLGRMVKSPESWRKWDITPGGDRVMVGSTTGLTVYGMAQYLDQVYAFGSGLGVMFSAARQGNR